MFSSRRSSWFSLRREVTAYRWPHPLAPKARKWLDKSLYLPWAVGR